MPKRILIIGILFCSVGLFGVWTIVSGVNQLIMDVTQLNLDVYQMLSALLLPIGIGLLLGKPWSQWWARLLIIVGCVFCFVSIIFAIASPEDAYATWFEQSLTGVSALPYVIIPLLILAGVLGYFHKLLYSPKAKDYFNRLS